MSLRFPLNFTTPAILALFSTGFLLVDPTALRAQSPGVQGTAEREILRRQQITDGFATDMIAKGNRAMSDKDYESAFSYFRAAVDALPLGGQAVQPIRKEAMDGFCNAAVSLARQRISEGRFEDADEIVQLVLSDKYNPNYKPALSLEAQLRDPQTFNRAITPKYVADVEEVKRLLIEADGFYQSGRYDLAFKRYEQVLNVDKYNIAARRGMEKVNNMRQRYASTAYSESRSTMLNEVEKGWEIPPRRYDLGVSTIIEQPTLDVTGTASISQKLDEIIIPKIDFRDASVREAIDFIRARAAALDTSEPDPTRRGVNIVLKLDAAAQAAESMSRITLTLNDLPLKAVLDYVASAAGLKVKVESHAVAIVPLSEPTEVLITKEYKVPPSFLNNPDTAGGGGGSSFGATETTGPRSSKAKDYLESQGVTFPEGASAQYLPSSSKLIVRNTPSNLDLIDSLVEISLATPPTQISIESKFLEVTQNDLQELGFDWLVGQFALAGGSGVYGSGGTQGNQGLNAGTNYPMGAGTPFQPFGASSVDAAGNVQSGQVSAGTRTGSMAIKANALDGLLFGSPLGPAPGVLALAGVFTNPQFQVVLRALDQAKGVDLMSAPSVTTKSGQSAKVQIVREFIYPASYSPPEVPTDQAVGVINPATPATPQDWAMEPIGVELEVEPIIGPDGFTIELNLRPKVTEFEGFINYGSPIATSAQVYLLGTTSLVSLGTQSVVLTNNVINQPVFSFREVTTNVTIYDGQTVALGGLIREDVQKVEDKVPIIGDIPIAGRLFRSSADQRVKRNLIIFVTANLIDPSGQPLIKDVEDDMVLPVASETLINEEIVPGDASSIAPQL